MVWLLFLARSRSWGALDQSRNLRVYPEVSFNPVPILQPPRLCYQISKVDVVLNLNRILLSRIKVLVFINSFRAGGSERQALEVIKRLDRTKFEPFVACFQREGPLLSELPSDIDVIHTFHLRSFFSWSTFKQGKEFSRILRQAGIHIIQCFDFYSNLFAIPWGRVGRVPIILGARRDEASMRTPRQHYTELFVYKLATGVIANAESIKDQLVARDKLIPDKVWVIQNGLDLDRFDGRRQHALDLRREGNPGLSLAVVANLRPEKGHLVFLDACRHLADRFSTLKVFIVGNGPMKESIAKRIGELKLTNCVEMAGELKNIPEFFQGVDIAVLPSLKNEGLPICHGSNGCFPACCSDRYWGHSGISN